ncbi:MAG: hypothetical protein KAT49_01290 [Methanomicrobia archaeon]|nr:hypothetical protein [Methanomicrobia archaeon]
MSIVKEHKKYIISKKEIDLLLEKSKDSPLLRHIKKMAKDEDLEKVRKILSKIDTSMSDDIVKERNEQA